MNVSFSDYTLIVPYDRVCVLESNACPEVGIGDAVVEQRHGFTRFLS